MQFIKNAWLKLLWLRVAQSVIRIRGQTLFFHTGLCVIFFYLIKTLISKRHGVKFNFIVVLVFFCFYQESFKCKTACWDAALFAFRHLPPSSNSLQFSFIRAQSHSKCTASTHSSMVIWEHILGKGYEHIKTRLK